MMTVFVVALGAALVGGDAQAQPSFPGCQNLPGGVSYSSWLSTRPVSEFNTGGAIGPFDHFFIHRDFIQQWPACLQNPAPGSPGLSPTICPLEMVPHTPHGNSSATQDHPYATTPDTTVGRHNGAHIEMRSSEFPIGLNLWTVEIQAPTPGMITIKGLSRDPCSVINATNDPVNPGLLAKANVDIQFATNDRSVPPSTTPADGAWDFRMSLEPQHRDVICVRKDRSWVWEDAGLSGQDADNDPLVAGMSDNFLQILVEDGDCVAEEDVIAIFPVKTNATRGPHVHFNVSPNDLNPAPAANWYCPNVFDEGVTNTAQRLLRDTHVDWEQLSTLPASDPNHEPLPAFCFDYDDNAATKWANPALPLSDNLFPDNR
ncbi:MAG: hypothetical protein CMH57_06430 [Myxococcales bacterium]|nr:hypothetical protein [Myxococcales bacterium]